MKATNADAQVWGTLLLKAKHVGDVRTVPLDSSKFNASAKAAAASQGHSTAPADDLPITDMPVDMLPGAFLGANRTTGIELANVGYTHLLVVDARSSLHRSPHPGASLRSVKITLGQDCADSAKIVPGGAGGWSEVQEHAPTINGRQVSLSLTAGAGALIKLSDSAECVASLKLVRQWWYHPRNINLVHERPAESLKSATCDAWGSAARHWSPGGLARVWSRRVRHRRRCSLCRP